MINSWTKKNSEFNPTWTKIIVTQQEALWKPSRAVARYLSLIISAQRRRSPKASICICRCVCVCECVCVCVYTCVCIAHMAGEASQDLVCDHHRHGTARGAHGLLRGSPQEGKSIIEPAGVSSKQIEAKREKERERLTQKLKDTERKRQWQMQRIIREKNV